MYTASATQEDGPPGQRGPVLKHT